MGEHQIPNFITLPSNEEAVSVCLALIKQLRQENKEVFLYCLFGPIGCGKTHLLKSIQASVGGSVSSGSIRYMQTEELVMEFIQSKLERGEREVMLSEYAKIDLLLIDNFEYLRNRPMTYDMIIEHLSETLLNNQRSVVVSLSDFSNFPLTMIDDLKQNFENVRFMKILPPSSYEIWCLLKEKFSCCMDTYKHKVKMWDVSRSSEGDISRAIADAERYFLPQTDEISSHPKG